ncbi:MAG: rhodanese-like domain-containing protein [Clostridia bacterium]|nr:rhodanese-like domain-containing protein [Clostridia bacterium]
MGFFDFLRQPDVNQGVNEYKNSTGAVLLDVRTPQEYSEGHIPQSKNVPLQTLDKIRNIVDNKDTELFVYCYSGARSRQAAAMLEQMGYTNVKNIGGISSYRGKVER